ncbi:helix-turn-helix domain-containing protein [Desnuesiella massiliensis]|uniref:helix-turn-helix domain-containing protein n=1 Tax=Desnuesiella massiliensis TaxID=1650662 RepID=UPI0006E40455|nr:helix-turn-helix transcriptional regulator [Desnuesiella massiliensis]
MDYKKIGERIQKERLGLGLTREKIAEILNLSANFIGQIERGEKKMSLATMVKISECLRVSIDYLIYGKDTEDENINDDELTNLIRKCSKLERSLILDIVKSIIPYIKK